MPAAAEEEVVAAEAAGSLAVEDLLAAEAAEEGSLAVEALLAAVQVDTGAAALEAIMLRRSEVTAEAG